ncbi:MAG: hypothetical protein KC457_09030 [Myxococcales bacterium]|nr:hypothetical protein [Myxococcales bacterium]
MPVFTFDAPAAAKATANGALLIVTIAWGTEDQDGETALIPAGYLDHASTAQNLLWKQFETLPDAPEQTWLDTLRVIGQAWLEHEQVLGQVERGRTLTSTTGGAFGLQLELIGELVGLRRGGLADELYRRAIRVQASSLSVSGTHPELLAVALAMFPDNVVGLFEVWPAGLVLVVVDLSLASFQLMAALVGRARFATVRASLEIYATEGEALAGAVDYAGEIDGFGAFGYEGVVATDPDSPGFTSYGVQF